MENQVSSKSIILNYGLYLGIATVLINLVNYAMGNHLDPHWSIGVISGALFIGFIIYGIKNFKEANGGIISWGQAVKIGVGVVIIAALIGSIYNYIFMNFIEPDYMSQLMEVQNQKYLDQGLTEEQIEMSNSISEKFKNPTIIAATGIIGSAIGGFIVSAIAGAFMKESGEEEY